MGEHRRAWLGWFMEFCQTDLDGLTPLERGKLALEVSIAVGGRAEVPIDGDVRLVDHETLKKIMEVMKDPQLEEAHRLLKDFFINIMNNIYQLREFLKDGCHDTAIEDTPLNAWPKARIAGMPVEMVANLEVEPNPVGGWPFVIPGGAISCDFNQEALNTPLRLSLVATGKGMTLLIAFCRLLDGLPIGAFRKCLECGKWYLHPSRREREFCTNKCASRYGSRRKRARGKQ